VSFAKLVEREDEKDVVADKAVTEPPAEPEPDNTSTL